MDELEISGKRYISTRRAAKEHKYNSDYIGQLIRGKKVEGQKVGRSWYVVADSLSEYLKKEGNIKVQVTMGSPAPTVVDNEQEEEISGPRNKVGVAVLEEESPRPEIAAEEVEVEEEENYIPVKISQPEIKKSVPTITAKRSSLRYLADDGPLYPRMETQPKPKIKIRPLERQIETIVEETVYIEEEPLVIIEKPRRKKNNFKLFAVRGGVIVAAGVIVLGAVAAASALIISTTTVKEGAASVSYSIGNV